MKLWLSKGSTIHGVREVEAIQIAGKSVHLMFDGKPMFMSLGRDIHDTREEALEVVRKRHSRLIADYQKQVARFQRKIEKLHRLMEE